MVSRLKGSETYAERKETEWSGAVCQPGQGRPSASFLMLGQRGRLHGMLEDTVS